MMTGIGVEGEGQGHVHLWSRDGGDCSCGAPVPAYLAAAWSRYAEREPD